MEDVGLAIRQRFKLELVLHIGYNWQFSSKYKDIAVVIGRWKIRHLIFVIEDRDYNLDLG